MWKLKRRSPSNQFQLDIKQEIKKGEATSQQVLQDKVEIFKEG